MSILAAMGKSQRLPCRTSSNLPPFGAISQDDFRQLLRYLIDIDHVQQQTEQVNHRFDRRKVVRSFQFYAVFADNKEYTVRDDSMEIGYYHLLAGRTWR